MRVQRTRGEPNEIKKNTHTKSITALVRSRPARSALACDGLGLFRNPVQVAVGVCFALLSLVIDGHRVQDYKSFVLRLDCLRGRVRAVTTGLFKQVAPYINATFIFVTTRRRVSEPLPLAYFKVANVDVRALCLLGQFDALVR